MTIPGSKRVITLVPSMREKQERETANESRIASAREEKAKDRRSGT